MKIPVIRQLFQNSTPEDLEATLTVLEAFCEFRGVNEEEVNVAGEMITNICGALEVHESVKSGMVEKDALNAFGQKVMGSIDRN
ncbi:DUF6952 family protein [Pedobacter hiemivivus]|uniref:Uncharacterized protein n=1 Tax=Pedobacter hiemivivus TaxID=2530454 RepID=A0A4R0MIE9_9SPHI|nr:hypothetical protein [Pedobacter hiemivivus]TCC86315.1 hypothetical protein EZ444_24325 [Pedobacter hiemivivus]